MTARENLKYTREDLLEALAADLGASPDDPRIIDAYDDIVSSWALDAPDTDLAYDAYFGPGLVATDMDMTMARAWAAGRILID